MNDFSYGPLLYAVSLLFPTSGYHISYFLACSAPRLSPALIAMDYVLPLTCSSLLCSSSVIAVIRLSLSLSLIRNKFFCFCSGVYSFFSFFLPFLGTRCAITAINRLSHITTFIESSNSNSDEGGCPILSSALLLT